MRTPILTIEVRSHQDVVDARQRARCIAAALGFGAQDQARIATAVSEIARNALRYADGGAAQFFLNRTGPRSGLAVVVTDRGSGIADLGEVLSGRYQSQTGMGIGIVGARRLMDGCEITTGAERGTEVVLEKWLPPGAAAIDDRRLAELAQKFAARPHADAGDELQQQNRELLQTLGELRSRQDELTELTRELEDTNRGVVALYAELDEKALHLRRADAMKSRFLSNVSHEFRTPLSSIRALTKLLLDRVDGDLSAEQEKQVRLISDAAENLSELVNDLLDLAKIEAGKIDVRTAPFTVGQAFGALRGLLRPLLVSDAVDLVFEEVGDPGELYTDEAKLAQILRNFISNALKFTESGEVRVRACAEGADQVRFEVIDTGIGIPAESLQLIFEEFSQIENPLQRRVKGTGLGLPLCKKLAQLLGGSIEVASELGRGSTFSLLVPRRLRLHAVANESSAGEAEAAELPRRPLAREQRS